MDYAKSNFDRITFVPEFFLYFVGVGKNFGLAKHGYDDRNAFTKHCVTFTDCQGNHLCKQIEYDTILC